tara:strand:- start:781 stop:1122 length:342 start_codon:yes stop_codon:yes gene_type:complete
MSEITEYKDKNYMKKNKDLCVYCSYRCAVPSKNNLYCSELCRLLHLTITEDIDIKDIAKLIKLSKIDLINIILSLKCMKISRKDIIVLFDKNIEKEKQKSLKIKKDNYKITFD